MKAHSHPLYLACFLQASTRLTSQKHTPSTLTSSNMSCAAGQDILIDVAPLGDMDDA